MSKTDTVEIEFSIQIVNFANNIALISTSLDLLALNLNFFLGAQSVDLLLADGHA